MNLQLFLAILCTLIIIALSLYSGMLIKRIRTQKAQLAAAIREKEAQLQASKQQRNDNICDSIRFIARATSQKQCNVSEAAIRLSVLLETLQVTPKIDIDGNYPAISTLFEKIKDFATHDERKEMDKKSLKQQDKQRQQFENELEDAIIDEASSLISFSI